VASTRFNAAIGRITPPCKLARSNSHKNFLEASHGA
jgi:hypothetical protein